ncbi:MAG: aldose 1-epimerase [Clostridia bacterium]|nr:aldose 1-epimerase [Clostridia bacterium]
MKYNIKSISGGEYVAKINVSRGGNCISLRNTRHDASLLRELDTDGEPDNPYLYGMPILFPTNRISGGRFEFEGREYVFDINEPETNCHLHGHIHEKAFEVADEGEDYISCIYKSDGKDTGFPHKFRIKMDYSLSKKGLLHKTEIANLSNQNMPIFLGFHTTFRIPFMKNSLPDDIRISAQIGEEIERNMSEYLPTGRMVKNDVTQKFHNGTFKPFEKKISCHANSVEKGLIEIIDNRQKIKLVYENDLKYKFRLFYNGNADEYICLEPMTCMANCQNSSFDREYAGFDYIEPGKTKEYISKIYIEEGI